MRNRPYGPLDLAVLFALAALLSEFLGNGSWAVGLACIAAILFLLTCGGGPGGCYRA